METLKGVMDAMYDAAVIGFALALRLMLLAISAATCAIVLTAVYAVVVALAHMAGLDLPGWPTGGGE